MPDDSQNAPSRRAACPICGKISTVESRPFCSKRCADVDLGRWLKGRYAIPGDPVDQATGSEPEDVG